MNTLYILQFSLLVGYISLYVVPTNVEMIRRGLKEGWKSAALFACGNLIALIVYLVLVILGFSFLAESKLFYSILFFFGAAIMFYFFWNAWKDFRNININGATQSGKNGIKNIIHGAIITILNPIVFTFWITILKDDFSEILSLKRTEILLITAILAGNIVFYVLLIGLIHKIRNYMEKNGSKALKYFSLIAGGIFLYFGIKFGIKLIALI